MYDVVIPHKNGHEWLQGAIETVLNQTLQANNIYIVDDSSMQFPQIETQLIQKNPQIQLVKNMGIGLSAARNTGIQLCKSKFIAFLDVDDRWKIHKMEHVISNFAINKNAIAIYSGCNLISMNGSVMREYSHPYSIRTTREILTEKKPILGSASSLVAKAEALKKCGYFDENLKYAEDLDYWIRLSLVGEILSVPKILVDIQHNPNSMQRKLSALERLEVEIQSKVNIYRKFPEYKNASLHNMTRSILITVFNRSVPRNHAIQIYSFALNNFLDSKYSKVGFTLKLTLISTLLILRVLFHKTKNLAMWLVTIPFRWIKNWNPAPNDFRQGTK